MKVVRRRVDAKIGNDHLPHRLHRKKNDLNQKSSERTTSAVDAQEVGAVRDDFRVGDSDLEARLDALVAENERLRQAVSARDNFLAIAAHELRNPMTPILGRLTMLRRMSARGTLTREELDSRLAAVEGSIVGFIKRATMLLDVSRVASDHVKVECSPVNITELVSQIADNLRAAAAHAGAQITVSPAVPLDVVVAVADPLATEQIIENLVFNAIKYGEGSPITITTSANVERRIAVIAVADRGPGISDASRARIFKRFERAVDPGSKTSGYGIGLWLVRNLCEAMDGAIEIESSPGNGSTFSALLPLYVSEDDR